MLPPKPSRHPTRLPSIFAHFLHIPPVVAKPSVAQRRHTSSPSLRIPKQPINGKFSPETFPSPSRYTLAEKEGVFLLIL